MRIAQILNGALVFTYGHHFLLMMSYENGGGIGMINIDKKLEKIGFVKIEEDKHGAMYERKKKR